MELILINFEIFRNLSIMPKIESKLMDTLLKDLFLNNFVSK